MPVVEVKTNGGTLVGKVEVDEFKESDPMGMIRITHKIAAVILEARKIEEEQGGVE